MRIEFSRHALQRALEMAADADDIKAVLENPRHRVEVPGGREMWTRGRVSLVMAPITGGFTVVTVLWATANAWATERVGSRDRGVGADRARAQRYAMKMRKRGRTR